MPPSLDSALRRSKAYWLRDGIPEIVIGAYFALVGALFVAEAALGAQGRSVSALGLPIVIVGGTLAMPAIIKALKSRITYPRTGYAVHRQARVGRRRAAGIGGALVALAVVAGVALLTADGAQTNVPVASLVTGAILCAAYLVAGFGGGQPRMFLVALAAGASVTISAALGADDTIGMAALFLSAGLVQASLGIVVLRRYLASTSPAGPEDGNGSEGRGNHGPATADERRLRGA